MTEYTKENLAVLSTRSTEFQLHYDSIAHQRALLGGTIGMRNAGETYLPREEAESTQAYNARKNRTFLLNVYKKTLNKLVGEIFSKQIVASDDMPSTLRSWMTDVDLDGNNITIFASDICNTAFHAGYCGVYCDYSDINGFFVDEHGRAFYQDDVGETMPINIEAQKKNNWRPYLRKIDPDTIRRASFKRINGKRYLSEIVVVEEISNDLFNDIFEETIERMQIFSIGRVQTYLNIKDAKSGGHTWELEGVVETGLSFIPLFFLTIGKEKMGNLAVRSELEDLGWLNICHWQSASDQRNVLHYARLITYFGRMLDDVDQGKKIVMGANSIIMGSDPDSLLTVVEHSGKATESGQKDLDTLKDEMYMTGLQLMLPKTDRETATGKMIDTSESDSVLKSWALKIDQFVNTLLTAMYIYGKAFVDAEDNSGNDVKTIGKLTVNTELKSIFSVSFVDLILRAKSLDIVSDKIAAMELQRRNLISGDVDTNKMVEEIRKQKKESEKKKETNMDVNL